MKWKIVLVIITAVLLIGGGSVFLALGGWRVLSFTTEDEGSVPAEIKEFRVSGGAGSVEIRPSAGSQIEIHRKVYYLNPFFDGKPENDYWVDGDVLHLDTGCGGRCFCVADYVIDAPAGVRVSGELSTGSFRLTATSTVDVKTSTGSITLTDVTGDVTAQASTGSIKAEGLRSTNIDTKTSTGKITLDLAIPANVRARTSTGGIELAVPQGGYQIDTNTSRTDIGVQHDPTAAHRLDLSTSNGKIVISYR